MINLRDEKAIRSILGKDMTIEICNNRNLRITGHIDMKQFERLFGYSNATDLIFTLGADGVLVVHD